MEEHLFSCHLSRVTVRKPESYCLPEFDFLHYIHVPHIPSIRFGHCELQLAKIRCFLGIGGIVLVFPTTEVSLENLINNEDVIEGPNCRSDSFCVCFERHCGKCIKKLRVCP